MVKMKSGSKSVHNYHHRLMIEARLEAAEASKRSPTRVMDFDDDIIELDEEDAASNRAAIVRELGLDSLDIGAPQDITPISPSARQRQRNIKTLPTLDEKDLYAQDVDLDSSNTSAPLAGTVAIKTKKRAAHLPKPSRAEKIQEVIDKASDKAATGDEEDAVKFYRKALRFSDAECARIQGQIAKSGEMHPMALKSIHTRLQEDLLVIVLLIGKVKIKMTNLYERQGDYDNAILYCKEAKALYKKQKKRSPPVPTTPASTLDVSLPVSPGSNRNNNNDVCISPGSRTTSSSSSGSCSDLSLSPASCSTGESDGGVWYVPCPTIDKLLRDTSQLLERLKRAQETFEDRRKMIEEILLLRQEIVTTFDPAYRSSLYSKAEKMAAKALDVERRVLGQWHPQVADTLQLLSVLALEQQREKPRSRDKAIQYLLQSLEINQKSLGKKHPRTGQDLLRMARLYQQPAIPGMSPDDPGRLQDEDRAIAYFTQAADVFENVTSAHTVVGSILNDLAVIHVARRDFVKALELLEKSLKSYEADAEESSGDVADISIDAVQVYRNMGECHVNLRDFNKAIDDFVNALHLQRDARKKHDAAADSDLESVGEEKSFLVHLMQMISDESIADTLRRLGKALAAAARNQEAMTVYREAMEIHRSAVREANVLSKGRSDPTLPNKLDLLANVLYCIAEVYDATSNYDNAIRIFNESMQLRITSDGHRPENQRCNMIHCAMCLVGIANVHLKKKDFLEAHKLYNHALFFCEAQGIPFSHAIVSMIERKRKEAERMVAVDPARNAQLIRLEDKAESHRLRGEFDQAIATLSEALAIRQATFEKLKTAMLDTSAEIKGMVLLLQKLENVFARKGDNERAKRARCDAVRLSRKINEKRVPPVSSV